MLLANNFSPTVMAKAPTAVNPGVVSCKWGLESSIFILTPFDIVNARLRVIVVL